MDFKKYYDMDLAQISDEHVKVYDKMSDEEKSTYENALQYYEDNGGFAETKKDKFQKAKAEEIAEETGLDITNNVLKELALFRLELEMMYALGDIYDELPEK